MSIRNNLQKVILALFILFIGADSQGSNLPQWSIKLPQPLPDPPSDYDLLLYRHVHINFEIRDNETIIQERQAWLVGGRGQVSSFYQLTSFVGEKNLDAERVYVITPEGDTERLSKDVLEISTHQRSGTLHSDDMLAEWSIPEIDVGSVVLLEWEQKIDRLLNYIDPVIQEETTPVTRLVITAESPDGGTIEMSTRACGDWLKLRDGPVAMGTEIPKWTHRPYVGGYSGSVGRIEIRLISDNTPKTWNDVARKVLSYWNDVYTPFTAGQNSGLDALTGFQDAYESEYRYVAIELEEGRFIPHSLETIHDRKYGDCKDLTLVVLDRLAKKGVTARPILTNLPASRPFRADIPSMNQFNHAIVGWIEGADTFYYDPTGHDYQPGEISWQSQGAPALWLDSSGTLAWIPQDTIPIALNYSLHGTLNPDGLAECKFSMKFDKRQRGSVESIFDDLDTELAASVFYDDLKRDVSSYSADEDSLIILVDASLSGFVRQVGSRTMVRLFPFDMDDWPEPEDPGPEGYMLPRPVKRNYELTLKLPWQVADQVIKQDTIRTMVGEAIADVSVKNNILQGNWILSRQMIHLPADKKEALQALIDAARDHQNAWAFLTVD